MNQSPALVRCSSFILHLLSFLFAEPFEQFDQREEQRDHDRPDHEALAHTPVQGTPGTVPPAWPQLPQPLFRPANRAGVRIAEELPERNQLLFRVEQRGPFLRRERT